MARWSSAAGARRRAPLRTAATLLLAVLAAATGTLEVHPHPAGLAGDHGHHAAHGESLLLGASHPAAAPHVEAVGAEVSFRCPVCLLQLHSAGEVPDRALPARPPGPPSLGAPSAEAAVSAAARQPGGARAPPVR